jgi:dipeptidyl-peptidase-4
VRTFEDNARTTAWLATHAFSPESTFTVTASDGARIDASIIKPVPFDPSRKYPMVFAVYGGPGSQGVYDRFDTSGWEQWLAQQGYIVIDVNNRGTNNYGSAFMKTVYGHLGKWESHDFAEVARHLGTLPYVDARRTAIMGTSYGGYSTLYTMTQYPELFPVGIANSAVTDWRLYDTIYTERYMGTLGDNAAGYEASSVIANAAKLEGKLLLIHAMMDDNVHPQQTMQLLTALTAAGKDADLRIYPPGRHGSAYDGASYRLIMQAYDRFLSEHLKGAAASADR